jgi:hypothetical protein
MENFGHMAGIYQYVVYGSGKCMLANCDLVLTIISDSTFLVLFQSNIWHSERENFFSMIGVLIFILWFW